MVYPTSKGYLPASHHGILRIAGLLMPIPRGWILLVGDKGFEPSPAGFRRQSASRYTNPQKLGFTGGANLHPGGAGRALEPYLMSWCREGPWPPTEGLECTLL